MINFDARKVFEIEKRRIRKKGVLGPNIKENGVSKFIPLRTRSN